MISPNALYRAMPAARRRTRRILVAAAFVGIPFQILGYVLLVARGTIPAVAWAPVSVVAFATTLVAATAIYGYGQGRMDHRERLDERQRSMVDRALVLSYAVLTTVIVLIGGVLAVYLSFIGPLQIDMLGLTPWFVAIGLYVPLLPFAALAWIEPDVPVDDDR